MKIVTGTVLTIAIFLLKSADAAVRGTRGNNEVDYIAEGSRIFVEFEGSGHQIWAGSLQPSQQGPIWMLQPYKEYRPNVNLIYAAVPYGTDETKRFVSDLTNILADVKIATTCLYISGLFTKLKADLGPVTADLVSSEKATIFLRLRDNKIIGGFLHRIDKLPNYI